MADKITNKELENSTEKTVASPQKNKPGKKFFVFAPSPKLASSEEPYAGPPKSIHFTTDTIKVPPHAPAHIGPLTEEEAEKEILDVPAKPPSLIDLIAEPEDNPEEEQKKKFEFNFLTISKIFKKYKDEVHNFFEQNPLIYKRIQITWMLLMSLLYMSGLLFFIIFFVLYFAFTPLLKGYLVSRGLSNVTFTVDSHSLSELIIKNIEDKQGLFKVKSIRLQYTFTDFLRGKITLANVDSLEIFIKQDKENRYNIRNLITTFVKLGLLDRNSSMQIQSLQFKNSKIYVGDQAYPIDFSGIGDLEKQRQFIIPFTVQNDYLTTSASLTISIEPSGTNWLINIDNGKLTLPKLPAENLSGTISWKTQKTALQNITASLSLKQENNEKKLSLQLTPALNGKINMNMILDFPGKSEEQKSSQINLTLRNVTIGDDLKSLSTKDPLNIKLTNLQTSFLKADSVQFTLNGALDCKDSVCTFSQSRTSDITLTVPTKKIWDTEITTLDSLRIALVPEKQDLFVLDKTNLTFDATLRDSSYNLTKKGTSSEVSSLLVSTGETKIKGNFDFIDKVGSLQTFSKNVKWADNILKFERAEIETQTDNNGVSLSLSTPSASLVSSNILKIPFSLKLQTSPDQYFNMELKSNNKQLNLTASGYFNSFTGEVLAVVETQPIHFNKDTLQPSQITSLIDNNFRDVSGIITCRGQIHWRNNRSIDGPMNILLDNISFNYGNTQVNRLSSMMSITSFIPFGTRRNQKAFIESIQTPVPFSNVDIDYYFDKTKRQLNISRMNLELANVIFRIDPTWLTYQSPVQALFFKAKNIDMSQLIPYINLTPLHMQGNISSASFSLQLNNKKFLMKNMELLIPQEGEIAYTPEKYPESNLKIFTNLPFKKATIILNELENETTDFLFIGDKTNSQDKKKTTIRFNITKPLNNFIKSANPKPIPEELIEKVKEF